MREIKLELVVNGKKEYEIKGDFSEPNIQYPVGHAKIKWKSQSRRDKQIIGKVINRNGTKSFGKIYDGVVWFAESDFSEKAYQIKINVEEKQK